MPSCRGSSQPRDQIWVSCIAGEFFTTELLGKLLLTSTGLQIWGWGDGSLFYLSSSSPPFLESCFSWKGHCIYLCWMDIPGDIWFLGLFFAAPLKTQESLKPTSLKGKMLHFLMRVQGELLQINYSCQGGKSSNYLINSSVLRNQPLDNPGAMVHVLAMGANFSNLSRSDSDNRPTPRFSMDFRPLGITAEKAIVWPRMEISRQEATVLLTNTIPGKLLLP